MTRNPSNVENWEKLQEEWAKITVDEYQKLVKSCGCLCAPVIQNKGLSSKY